MLKSVTKVILFSILQVLVLLSVAIATSLLIKNVLISIITRYVLAILIIMIINKYWMKQKIDFGFKNIKLSNQLSSFIMIFLLTILIGYQFKLSDLNRSLVEPLCFSIGPGLYEEYVCRGVILGSLLKIWKKLGKTGIILSIVVSNVLFGSAHLINLSYQPLLLTLMQCLIAFIVGTFLAIIYLRTKNILVPMFFHFLFDFINSISTTLSNSSNTTAIVYYVILIAVSLLLFKPSKIKL